MFAKGPHHIITWDEVARPDFGTPERQLYRETVHSVADRAKAAMDSCDPQILETTSPQPFTPSHMSDTSHYV
jgi:hypothetical protein